MTIKELIGLASARLNRLSSLRADAERDGDVTRLAKLDAEIADTEDTLAKLRTLTE